MDRLMLRIFFLLIAFFPAFGFSSEKSELLEFDEVIPPEPSAHISEINRLLDEYRFDEAEEYSDRLARLDASWAAHVRAYLALELMQEEACYESASKAASKSDLPNSIRSKWLVIASRCYGVSQEQKEEIYVRMFSFNGMTAEHLELAIQDLLRWAWQSQLHYVSQGRGSFQDSIRFDRESTNGERSLLIGSFRVGPDGQVTDKDILAMFPSREIIPEAIGWLSGRPFQHRSPEGGRVLFAIVEGLNHNKAKQEGTP